MTPLIYAIHYLHTINADCLSFTDSEIRNAIGTATDKESIERLVREMYTSYPREYKRLDLNAT